MLSVWKLAAGNQPERYYLEQVAHGREDYYAGEGEAPGQWAGSASVALGVDGQAPGGGEAIPIEGRIVAIADVFDALSSDRVYRPAFAPEKVLEIMSGDRGTHFDPDLLDASSRCGD